jgi:transforming growth factor-beta-induced protein
VDKAGLDTTLDDPLGTFTVFAPDNDAFLALLGAIGATSLDDLSADQLRPILLYHVLGTEESAADIGPLATGGQSVPALGGSIALSLASTDIVLDADGSAAIVELPDVDATNGVVHGISTVLLPSITDVVVSSDAHTVLEAALGIADTDPRNPNLVGTFDDDAASPGYTLFAPTDAAFTALLGALPPSAGIAGPGDFQPYQLLPILTYHAVGTPVYAADVTDGPVPMLGGTAVAATGPVTIDGAAVTVADLYTSNGVIHVIDAVILPSIADTVTTSSEFSGLKSLVEASEAGSGAPSIAGALDGAAPDGAWTLFAPSDAAIATIPAPAPTDQALTDILLFHAISSTGGVYAADALGLVEAGVPTALAGKYVVVDGNSGTAVDVEPALAGSADVTQANYLCANGVIHLVDDVLIPEAGTGITCAAQLEVSVGATPTSRANTTVGGGGRGNVGCVPSFGQDDRAYTVTPTLDGDLQVTVIPEASFDVSVFSRDVCTQFGTNGACEASVGVGQTEVLTVQNVTSGSPITIVVDGDGTEGAYTAIFEVI